MPNDPQNLGLSQPAAPGFGEQWKQWLSDPTNRAAMMQAGLALMQPIGVGQTFGGHVADAAGQGLEAKGRAEATALESKKIQAEADRASAAAARAEEGIGIQREKLEISRQREGRLGKGKGLTELFKSPAHKEAAIQKAYAKLAKDAEDASLLSGETVDKNALLSDPDWLARNRRAAEMTAGAAESAAPPAANSGAPTSQPGAPQQGQKRTNKRTGEVQQWDGTTWVQISPPRQ